MRLHFEKHGHEEVLRILEAKYRRDYKLWKEGKWLPTKIQLKRMKNSGFWFPTNQKTVPPKTKMEKVHIVKPNFTKEPLNENEPLANYKKIKRAKVDSQETVSKKLQMDVAAKSLKTETLQNQLTEKIKELADKICQNEALKLDLAQKSVQYNQSENSIKLLEKTIESLQSNISNLEDLVGMSANNLSEKSRQTDEANATIKQLEQSIKNVETDLLAKSEQCNQSEKKMAEEKSKNEGLKMDFEQLEISMKETIQNLQSNISKLEQSIDMMKKEHEEVTKNKI